jgi:hypothetical protein
MTAMKPHRGRVALKVGLLAAALLLALGPASASALACPLTGNVATAVLYETLESPPAGAAPLGPLPGTYIVATGERLAEAREAGTIQGCNGLAFMTGAFDLQGQSRVPFDPITVSFGTGSVSGVFQIDTVTGGGVAGKLLDGSVLDLSTIFLTGTAPVYGTWSTLGKNKVTGTFSGVFLMPFQIPGMEGWFYYYDPLTNVGPVPVQSTEFNNGVPLVKLVVTLTK